MKKVNQMGESVKLKKEEQKTNMKNIHGNEKKMRAEMNWLEKAEKNELRKKIVHEALRLED